MGKWHKPWQVATIIKMIKQDISINGLYNFEYKKGWTEAVSKEFYWNNTKWRIKEFTGMSYISFVPKNSSSYKHCIKYYLNMGKDKIKKKPNFDILRNESKDDLITIINILQEEVEKLRKEKSQKERNKSDCAIIKRIGANTKISERKLCICFAVNRKTYHNYKNVLNHGCSIRYDYKHNDLIMRSHVLKVFDEQEETAGPFKISGILNTKSIKISVPTVRRILRDANLIQCSVTRKFAPKELKDTSKKRDYFLDNYKLSDFKVGEVFSADFKYIETKYGNYYVHGIIDVISQKVFSLKFSENMSSDVVLASLNSLPKTAKIFNTDYGTQYFDWRVQNKLKNLNVIHSCGKPGKSTDNGWIERFWKRLECECLNKHNTRTMNPFSINFIINDYCDFWNKKRVMSNLNWMTPEKFFIINSGVN